MSLRPKVVAAIIRKDLHALWPMALVAIVLLLADIVVANFAHIGGSELRALLPLVTQLTCALLVVAAIQQDTAVSVSHDWLTKPISRVDVVAAKGAFIALALFAPIVLIRFVVYLAQAFSLGEALLTAFDVDDIYILLVLPVVIAVAVVTPTLLQAAAALIALFVLIFVVPTVLNAFDIPTFDERIIGAGSGWIWLWSGTVAALGVAAAVLYLQYGKRSTPKARTLLVVAPVVAILIPSFTGWPELLAIQRAVAPDPPHRDDFAISLNAGCFPAESTALLAGTGASSPQARLVGAGLWNQADLQQAGRGSIAFATGIAPRDLEEGWIMRVSAVVATYVDEHGKVLQHALPARIAPTSQMNLEGNIASTSFWLLPSAALERLQGEPSARLSLNYSLALLEPLTAELVADGDRRRVPGLGYCGANYDPADSTLAIDCFKRGAQPAWITARIPGAPLRTAGTPIVSYEPAWLEVLTGRRYQLALQVPAGVDHSKVELTAYEGRSHFERRVERAGVLGGPLADCPLPADSPQAPIERGVWQDTSPHDVVFVSVAGGVRLEVLDWGGSGRPVVLLHGLGATAHSFDDFAQRLAERYRVIGITRRGIGASTLAESGYDLPRRTEDVLRVLDALGIDSSAVVMGHSMGGEELNELGARHSDRIAGLVYLDAAFDRTWKQPPEFDAVQDALPEAPPAKPKNFTSYAELRDYMIRVGGVALPEGEILATFSFTPSGSVGGRAFDPRVLEAIEDSVVKPDYAAFKVPALALYAVPRSADDFVRPWYDRSDPALRATVQRQYELTVGAFDYMKRAFEEGVPNARAVNVLGAQHFIFTSNEAEVLAEIERFIAELPPR